MSKTNLRTAVAERWEVPVGPEPVLDARLLADARAVVRDALTPAVVPLLAEYRRALSHVPRASHYRWFASDARAVQADLLRRAGGEGFAVAHAALMIEAIDAFHVIAPAHGYPASILDRFRFSYSRILAKVAAGDWTGYEAPRDLLWKDFGLARQRLMPGGARVIEPEAWLPRSLLWRGGPRQAPRVARLLAAGRGPYLALHTHDLELSEFNADGWRALLLRVADLLRMRSTLAGMFVGGWLYDPKLPAVSPRLAYHRAMTTPHGAETYLYARDGAESYAFAKSETRRRAYAAGLYRPEQHILVWRRDDLIAWADAQPS